MALIKRDALQHNLQWMQRFADERGLQLAPHGKTSMSPQLFSRRLAAGAWGMTFANVAQARTAIGAGALRCLIANQVFQPVDLLALSAIGRDKPGQRLVFLLDSPAQLLLIEDWWRARGQQPFEVLIECGVPGGRTGCRSAHAALALAALAHGSPAVQLVGVECYEGLGATGSSDADTLYAKSLLRQVIDLAHACDQRDYFDTKEVLISAGGSAIFDLVAGELRPALKRTVTGILRSGCYLTHDQHAYLRWANAAQPPLAVGDLVALGLSHPCTTFDKWRWLPLVDDAYNVVDAIVTCF